MSAPAVSAVAADVPARVTRSRRSALWAAALGVLVVVVLGYLPYIVYSGTTTLLVEFFILVAMASMWNLLAGYAGLVSVGQQSFVGFGSYFVLMLAQRHLDPFLALPIAAVGCGVVGLVAWWLVSRLRTGYFAIATWVIASVCYLIIIRYPSLGGGTGTLLPNLPNVSDTLLDAYTYWASLVVVVVVVAGTYAVLRSRLGLVLTAVRDDETGAHSVGAPVSRARLIVFLIAAVGCGLAGGLEIISQQFVEPATAFGIQWTAYMIFATIIGGIGTIEGPILGSAVFFALQQWLSADGTWYFIILGLLAMCIAIWAPRGLWGLISDRFGIKLFPVGYYLWPAGDNGRRWRLPGRRRPGEQS
jgi:branched-chain amino acid transport system permease protein